MHTPACVSLHLMQGLASVTQSPCESGSGPLHTPERHVAHSSQLWPSLAGSSVHVPTLPCGHCMQSLSGSAMFKSLQTSLVLSGAEQPPAAGLLVLPSHAEQGCGPSQAIVKRLVIAGGFMIHPLSPVFTPSHAQQSA